MDYTFLKNKNSNETKNLETDKIKTTNINILLNRVKLDKKKTLRKRIIFSFFLASVLSCLVAYFII